MRRPLTFWLGLLGSCWLPALALAQSSSTPAATTPTTGGLTVVLLNVGGEAYNQRKTPLGKAQCDANADLHFRVTGFATGPASPKYVEIYKGTACNTTDAKDMVGDDDCIRVMYADRQQSNPIQEFHIPLMDICSEDGDVTLYFLPVDTLNTNAMIMPYGVYELPIDIIPPNAPTNVAGGVGETEIPITWSGTGQSVSRNWLVWDPDSVDGSGDAGVPTTDASTPSGSDSCSSPALMPGQAFDLSTTDLRTKEVVGDVYSATLSAGELAARKAALAVIAEDLAGNQSVLSNVTCVQVVPTDGFWDTYKDAGGQVEPGCACSLPGTRGGAKRHDATGLLAGLAFLVVCGVRFRRKRTS